MAQTPTITTYGVFGIHDTGAPDGGGDYEMLVMLHGLTWHSGTFRHILPLSSKFNVRIVLVNRRDYPGSVPFAEEEVQAISSIKSDTAQDHALEILKRFMKERAKELYDFLELFISQEKIPQSSRITLAGWSYGTNWMTAFLAYVHEFVGGKLPLADYIKRVVLYDPPYQALGYPAPENLYKRVADLSKTEKILTNFHLFVSGYYQHGDLPSGIEYRKWLDEPRPTFATMSSEEVATCMSQEPAFPGRAENVLLETNKRYGLCRALKDGMLYLPLRSSKWDRVKVRYVWCDHASWEMAWNVWNFQTELEEAKGRGKQTRDVEITTLKGLNHFAHWDQPERLLHALLDD